MTRGEVRVLIKWRGPTRLTEQTVILVDDAEIRGWLVTRNKALLGGWHVTWCILLSVFLHFVKKKHFRQLIWHWQRYVETEWDHGQWTQNITKTTFHLQKWSLDDGQESSRLNRKLSGKGNFVYKNTSCRRWICLSWKTQRSQPSRKKKPNWSHTELCQQKKKKEDGFIFCFLQVLLRPVYFLLRVLLRRVYFLQVLLCLFSSCYNLVGLKKKKNSITMYFNEGLWYKQFF